jgi:hypothetical protein
MPPRKQWATTCTETDQSEQRHSLLACCSYKKGFGWNAQEKAEELMHAEARYIIARDPQTRQMLGFVHYRFELDDDAEYPIVYWYGVDPAPQYRLYRVTAVTKAMPRPAPCAATSSS